MRDIGGNVFRSIAAKKSSPLFTLVDDGLSTVAQHLDAQSHGRLAMSSRHTRSLRDVNIAEGCNKGPYADSLKGNSNFVTQFTEGRNEYNLSGCIGNDFQLDFVLHHVHSKRGPGVRLLDLSYNNLTFRHMQRIAELLSTNTTLTSLNLGAHPDDPDVMEGLAIGRALLGNKKSALTDLNLHDQNINSATLGTLAQALENGGALRNLDIGGRGYDSMSYDENVKHFVNVAKTHLDVLTKIPVKALRENSTDLTSLNLQGCGLGYVDFIVLAKLAAVNTVLTELDISNAGIMLRYGAEELVEALVLGGYPALTALTLQLNLMDDLDYSGYTDDDVNPPFPMSTLVFALHQRLKLNVAPITKVYVIGSTKEEIGYVIAPYFNANNALTSIGIRHTRLYQPVFEGLLAAFRKASLTSLDISGVYQPSRSWPPYLSPPALLSSLATGHFTSLTIQHHIIDLEGATALATVLRTHRTLTFLDLSKGHPNSSVELWHEIAKVLQENTPLRSLDLSRNDLYTKGDKGAKGGVALAEALKRNTVLEHLDLDHNHLGNDGGNAMAEMLSTNTTLRHLKLRRNGIGPDAGTKLFGVLLQTVPPKNLQGLYLAGNRFRSPKEWEEKYGAVFTKYHVFE